MGLRFASRKLLLQSSIKLPKTKTKGGYCKPVLIFPKRCNKPILNTQKGSYLAPRVCAAGQSGEGREGRQTEELLKNNPMC